jgi:hypothetical protein
VLKFQQWQAQQKAKQRAASKAAETEEAVMLQLSVEEQEERFRWGTAAATRGLRAACMWRRPWASLGCCDVPACGHSPDPTPRPCMHRREYAAGCLKGYQAAGRPTKPVERFLSKKREDPLLQV